MLTINGARVLDDVSTAASAGIDDSSAFEDSGSMQQRRDMVLSSGNDKDAGNQQITAIAHAVDRVLFPLPVGDALATMRADRQHRYSVFLRAIDEYCSPSVRSLLSGNDLFTK